MDQPQAETPGQDHGRIDDDPQQPRLPQPQQGLHLAAQRLGLGVLFDVIGIQPRQEQQAGHPGDHRQNVQAACEVIGVHAACFPLRYGQAFQSALQP